MKKHEKLHGPNGICIELDATQIFPDDPGNGTPAIVRIQRKNQTYYGTYWCVAETGEVDGLELSQTCRNWIDSKEEYISKWHNWHTNLFITNNLERKVSA